MESSKVSYRGRSQISLEELGKHDTCALKLQILQILLIFRDKNLAYYQLLHILYESVADKILRIIDNTNFGHE